jgi:hypothetical protein
MDRSRDSISKKILAWRDPAFSRASPGLPMAETSFSIRPAVAIYPRNPVT